MKEWGTAGVIRFCFLYVKQCNKIVCLYKKVELYKKDGSINVERVVMITGK